MATSRSTSEITKEMETRVAASINQQVVWLVTVLSALLRVYIMIGFFLPFLLNYN